MDDGDELWDDPAIPIAPTLDEWRAMTPEAREEFLEAVIEFFDDPKWSGGEGRPHKHAINRSRDMLGLHFDSIGRSIYVEDDMNVLYPGERVFTPDILAVLDVPPVENDPRLAWVVADEGKGLDLVIEVLHNGSRRKDLVRNVERYARLGIPEYFVYDRRMQQIHGFRLEDPSAKTYARIVPQAGRYRSLVLGLDLAIQDERLRFFQGMAELFGTTDLIGRLQGMVGSLETKADRAQTDIERALADIERAQADAERAQADAERAYDALRGAVLSLLESRAIPCSGETRARVLASSDPVDLQRWALRAASASRIDDVFAT
jgi:hypothetical protein